MRLEDWYCTRRASTLPRSRPFAMGHANARPVRAQNAAPLFYLVGCGLRFTTGNYMVGLRSRTVAAVVNVVRRDRLRSFPSLSGQFGESARFSGICELIGVANAPVSVGLE